MSELAEVGLTHEKELFSPIPESRRGMSMETMRQTAWIGDSFVHGPIRAVIVNLHGLGFGGLKQGPTYEESEWAASGGLVVFPYYGPWSWMNREERTFVDELVGSVYKQFQISPGVPLIIAGASMGGLSSLIYTRYSAHRVTACFANFPVCDLEYHFTERADLPPTLRHAFRGYAEPFDKLLREHSPLRQLDFMPDIPYLIIHGNDDPAVNKQKHSDRFVAGMKRAGRNIDYLEVQRMGHGSSVPFEVARKQIDWVKGFFATAK